MDLNLTKKRALITGSTAGIGYAIAQRLADEGADVIINGRSQDSVDAACRRLKPSATGTVHGFAGDLSEADATNELFEKFPQVDILINNLGRYEAVPFEDIDDEEWMDIFQMNVLSGIRLSRLYLPYLKKQDWGRILFISSESGIDIPTEMIHYGVTKAAQMSVARGLAKQLAGTGITVNSILPGPTMSRGVEQFISEQAEKEGKSNDEVEAEFFKTNRPNSLIQRFASCEEVADITAFIASPLASATTGAAIRVEGGIVQSPS
jgi:NAD(P)-dependent dehydrogenase (short-subunit alcohol dehydrogenase family)